jgi:uncharacterized protein YggE
MPNMSGFKTATFASLLLVASSVFANGVVETLRTVAVNGTGSATATPDRAILNLSINTRRTTLAAAQKHSADVTAKVLALTDRLGIKREHVDSTGAMVRPDYRWNRQSEEQELRGYIAERQMKVNVRDLDKLGALIEGAVQAGVNQVSPPQLHSSERREAYRDALAKAAEDARANAEQLAKSLGVKLGPVMQINAGANTPPPMPVMRAQRADAISAESAPETYNPGQLSFLSNISVVFELL